MTIINQVRNADQVGIPGSVKPVVPYTGGWMQKKLSKEEMDYLWDCVEKRSKESYAEYLAGHLEDSFALHDKEAWFYLNTLDPLIQDFCHNFGNYGDKVPVNSVHPYSLHKWWVNYQRAGEYNPTHDHHGLWSFVIWMQIPYTHDEQTSDSISRKAGINSGHATNGAFEFHYTDIFGRPSSYWYDSAKDLEGTLVLFPSCMRHQVYPYYKEPGNKDYRITISGNIVLNTKQRIPVEMNTDLAQDLDPGMLERSHHGTETEIVKPLTRYHIQEYVYDKGREINNILYHTIQDRRPAEERPNEAHCTMTEWDLYSSDTLVRDLVTWIYDKIDTDFDPPEHDLKTIETWGVTYKKGEDIDWHSHGNATYSFVYYVNTPPGSSPILFQKPDAVFEAKAGNVIIFESTRKHKVPPNDCEGRCAISGNIFLKKYRK